MSLQIHLTAGSRNGQRLMAQSGPVSFGRDPSNTLVVDLAEVSRQHGELTLAPDGAWSLINHSPNGTLLGKKNITTKPGLIAGNVSLFIGKTEVMRLSAIPVNKPATSPTAEATAPAPAKGGMKMGLYMVCGLSACLILFMILQPLFSPPQNGPAATSTREFAPWTNKQLVKLIEAPPADPYPPDPVKYEEALRIAKDLYNPTSPMSLKASLTAYKAYREAMRHNAKELRDPLDKIDYAAICAEVEKRVSDDYNEACSAYDRLDYQTASRAFAKINEYTGLNDPLFGAAFRGHILKLKGLADAGHKK